VCPPNERNAEKGRGYIRSILQMMWLFTYLSDQTLDFHLEDDKTGEKTKQTNKKRPTLKERLESYLD